MQDPFMQLSVHDSHGVILSLTGCVCAYVCVLGWVLFKMDGVPFKKRNLGKYYPQKTRITVTVAHSVSLWKPPGLQDIFCAELESHPDGGVREKFETSKMERVQLLRSMNVPS